MACSPGDSGIGNGWGNECLLRVGGKSYGKEGQRGRGRIVEGLDGLGKINRGSLRGAKKGGEKYFF